MDCTFVKGMEMVRYTEPDSTEFVVSKIIKEDGTITLIARKERWTKFCRRYLGWRLWYKDEPGVHVTLPLPDGAYERVTLPLDGPYEGSLLVPA
jgi:hypothetical protein